MKKLIKYEFKKMWTQITIISVISLIVVSTILNILPYFSSGEAINTDGKYIEGIGSFRSIKNESKDMKGIMDQDYLDNLVKDFNSSKEKLEFEDSLGEKLTKYDATNHIINFANYGPDNYNIYMGLDFDFLKSEKNFYNQYKKSMKDTIKANNEKNWFKYTDEQMDKINEKIDKLETPFNADYYQGISYFIWQYGSQYWFVLIIIAFALSSIFSKDSNNGIDELTLSSKFGRKKNMNARIIAGNIFAVVVYLIFIGTLLIEHGAIASLQGWNQSAQNIWNTCLYNISAGTGVVIMIAQGLVSVILVTNIVMFISIKVRYVKLTTILSLSTILLLVRLTYTANTLQLQLNPIYYATNLSVGVPNGFEIFYFIGDRMIPYMLAFILLACVYMLIIRLLILIEYKKYRIN